MSDKTEKKYMKKSEIVTFGIGLFGVALMTGWMPDYTATFFADFAFKGKGFDSATMANAISMVFLVAGIIGAVCELVIGYLVDNTRTKLGKVKPWVGFGVVPLAVVAMLVFIAPNTSNQTLAIVWMFVIYSLYTAFSCAVERRTARPKESTVRRGLAAGAGLGGGGGSSAAFAQAMARWTRPGKSPLALL